MAVVVVVVVVGEGGGEGEVVGVGVGVESGAGGAAAAQVLMIDMAEVGGVVALDVQVLFSLLANSPPQYFWWRSERSDSRSQSFFVGAPQLAISSTMPGLCEAHQSLGTN